MRKGAALVIAVIAVGCLAWLAAAVEQGDTMMFDQHARRSLHMMASPGLTRLMEAVTLLGSQTAMLVVSGCAALGLSIAGRWKQAGLMAGAMAGAELLLWILKISLRRHRPDPFFDLPLPHSYSFPSGHSLLSLCCYGTLSTLWTGGTQRTGREACPTLVRIAAAVLILAIGISRVYLGMHWATDVIAGFLAGTAWMACVAFVYQR